MDNTILVIEDNPEMLDNIVSILELAHYRVITATNGKDGVSVASNTCPNLILCDVMMPELDGYGVLHLLSKDKATAGIPFIFLTAKTDKSDLRKGMNLGADDYITKPFDGLELLNVIDMRLKRINRGDRGFPCDDDGRNDYFKETILLGDFHSLAERVTSRKFRKREIIYLEGQRPAEVFIIQSGRIKRYKSNVDGKELILGFNTAGSMIGYLALIGPAESKENAVAVEDTEVYVIPKRDFLQMLYTNPELSTKLIKLLANNLQEAETRLMELAYQSVRQKVAGALLKTYQGHGTFKQKDHLITVSRKDLSSLVGIAIESLNRTLADFKEEGLIDVSGDGILLLNRGGIEQQLM